MAGNAKFELSSATPEDLGFAGSYSNGPRGVYPGAGFDRLGSFRENSNGRVLGSGASMPKGKASDLPPLSQCLMLEPFTLGDQKYSRSSELRRVLSFSFGSISDVNSIGSVHCKSAPALALDELKRLRGSVQDSNDKARTRVRMLDHNLNKLSAYIRKLQINERSSGPKLLKTGAQSHAKSPDLVTHKVDDRVKNVLSKRTRTPAADMRVEGRGIGIPRQHMVIGKDMDIKQGSLSTDSAEEKIRRLPAGGESWDRKMKRKRSISNVFLRPVDCDGEMKRSMHGRLSSDSGMPSSDAPSFRVTSNGGNTKSDGIPSVSSSSVRPTPKSESEKVSFSRELGGMNKERILQKGNNRLNIRNENHLVNPSLITKGKASRGGPPTMGNTSPTGSHMGSTPDDWELPSNVNKIHSMGGIINRKRAFSSESSSPPMAQWAGKRPQKVSRIRRTNIVSPTSNNDEANIPSEACAATDYVVNSGGFSDSLPARAMASNMQQLKVKSEGSLSPARFSEGEEICAAENRTVGTFESEENFVNGYLHGGSPGLLIKKTKMLVQEEVGDGGHQQGRSGRGSSFSRGSMSPLGEKLDSAATAKPVRSSKHGSHKNGSKSGRPPLKKNSECKGFTRLGLVPNGTFPDCTGESDDDREDLLAAAQFTCNANYHACSSSFWKKIEPLFSITIDDKSYLMQQLKLLEEPQGNPLVFIADNDVKDALNEEKHQPRSFGCEGEKVVTSYGFEPSMIEAHVKQGQESDLFCKRDFEEGNKGTTTLYQRLLSALVMEDEYEELEQNNCERNPLFLSVREVSCSTEEMIFCNGDTHSSIETPSQADLLQADYSFMQSETGVFPGSSQGNLNGSFPTQNNMPSDSSSVDHYALMSMDEKLQAELQSIGLHPETVPHLAEGEDGVFSEEILQLKKQFHQQANKKKLRLERIWKAVEVEMELRQWELEEIAVSRLVVLAYRKLLATRGSTAARIGVSKVPRNVAMAFVKRTLARCRKFEDTGKSCFSEPALWDVILAGPPSFSDDGLTGRDFQSEAKAPGSYSAGPEKPGGHDKPEKVLIESYDPFSHQPNHPSAKNGPILNRGKKKEVLLDDVGNSITLKLYPLGNTLMGGAKGKRSERDRDKDPSAKSGHPSITNLRGERKAKSKLKQRGVPQQLSTHPVFPSTANGSSRKQESGNILDSSEGKDSGNLSNLPVHELDSIELVVDNAFAGHQDLSSWLSFDDDDVLQDHDSMGLEIPMDDLSDLNMLL